MAPCDGLRWAKKNRDSFISQLVEIYFLIKALQLFKHALLSIKPILFIHEGLAYTLIKLYTEPKKSILTIINYKNNNYIFILNNTEKKLNLIPLLIFR